MEPQLEKYFVKTYPKIFRDMYGPPEKTCMHWGITCGAGWFFLLDNLCSKIQNHINSRQECIDKGHAQPGDNPIPQFVASQIKEKFGGLRFYYEGGDDYISALVDMTETLSYSTCESCGLMNEGVGRVQKGWIQSLCTTCAAEYGKIIVLQKNLTSLWSKVRKNRKNPNLSWTALEDLPDPEVLGKYSPKKKKKKKKKV